MNCVAVRELLPEMAMGVLAERELAGVEQHLRFCAGCRKEASELGQAAATFAFTLAPAVVPQALGDRVVARVRSASGAPGSRRRIRATAASVIAAMVAVAGLGWGAVQAGRADLFRDRAAAAEQRRVTALEQFQHVLAGLPVRVPADAAYLGQLAPVSGGVGGGAALLYSSPTVEDFSIVILNGLPNEDPSVLPLSITLRNPVGATMGAGRITSLDADGGGEVFHQFARDISSFSEVVVKDASGNVLFEGTVDRGGGAVA